MTKNFVTLNCYTCIEINAHCLVAYIRRCRKNPSSVFCPWLLSSQPCEKTFRLLRSLTSTFSTIVNFSMFEVLHRLNRAELLKKISQQSGSYEFAREGHRRLGNKKTPDNTVMPSEAEISSTIKNALENIKSVFLVLGIDVTDSTYYKPILKASEINDILEETIEQGDSNENSVINIDLDIGTEEILDSDEENCEQNLNLLKDEYSSHGTLQIKDFTASKIDTEHDINSLFLKVTLNSGKTMIVKKSTLVWLFQTSGNQKLSNDRLLRVRGLKDNFECGTSSLKPKKGGKKRKIRGRNNTRNNNYCLESTSESEDNCESSASSNVQEIEEEFDSNLHDENRDENLLNIDYAQPNPPSNKVYLKTEHYYAIFYEESWFLGRIISLKNEIIIKFLKQDLDKYIWPEKKNEDIQKVDEKYIFYGPIDLIGNGPFFVKRQDKLKIDRKFKALKKASS